MCLLECFIISTSEVGLIERGGKFTRLAQPGLGFVCSPFEQLAGKLSFRVQQLNVSVETKTLDNVFVTAVVTIQFQILREKVFEAFYALSSPTKQITAHVYDIVRSELPKLDLDEVFEAKEELALAVKAALSDTMTGYGYQILQALITDLDPDQRVKNAMNKINSSKRLKYAAAERAEGDKIMQVKAAEAEAEAKYLSGVGVAKQRKALVDGLRLSIIDFNGSVEGSSTKDVMDLLLLTQYFDAIKEIGSSKHCKTTFIPGSQSLAEDLRNSILQADAAQLQNLHE
jgi:regulator of protease activity HflC (stomatin/prohibitin superfamily)